jgi:integrase
MIEMRGTDTLGRLVKNTQIKTFAMASGERYCILVGKETGVPLFHPNLFVTTQIRNDSQSLSAMESALNGIQILLAFCEERGINLESRILRHEFLGAHELDAIRDTCQKRFDSGKSGEASNVLRFRTQKMRVEKATEYSRLTEIADYLDWISGFLLGSALDRNTSIHIRQMVDGLNKRRPPFRKRNQTRREYGFDDSQIEKLFEVITPGSPGNPFTEIGVQKRNNAMVNTLIYIGNRGGELLNFRIRDIKFETNHILIARRADEAADKRLYQPLVKTLDRLSPMRDSLAAIIHEYIYKFRNKVPNAHRHDYVFVTHKSGPTQGQPLSISGYQKMMKTIAASALELAGLHGHALRHAWNRRFSEFMDTLENPPSPEKQESLRSYLMGWIEGSGTAATYNLRFIEEKAMEASLQMQHGMIRIPENLNAGD